MANVARLRLVGGTMYISSIVLEDFRCFEGKHTLNYRPGLNFLVGNNNSGKTTVLRAVQFVLEGKSDKGWVTVGKEKDGTRVTITFSAVDPTFLEGDSNLQKLLPYVSSAKTLTIARSSKGDLVNRVSARGATTATINASQLLYFNPQQNEFETMSASKAISKLLQPIYLYGDINNDDYQDFAKTKTVGQLLGMITGQFKSTNEWQAYLKAHDEAFGPKGIGRYTGSIESELNECLNEQYGTGSVRFRFEPLDAESFFKNGTLEAEDNESGVYTDVAAKGAGMQRALAFALIRVLARRKRSEDSMQPAIFFLDEPETFLHPKAQDKLMDALEGIGSEYQYQVFITTHSPYLLRCFNSQKHGLQIFERKTGSEGVTVDDGTGEQFALLEKWRGGFGPSWGAINYFAFDVDSVDFHIELFGILQKIVGMVNQANGSPSFDKRCTQPASPTKVDDALCGKNTSFNPNKFAPDCVIARTDDNHKNCRSPDLNKCDQTMPVYIRNYIDHPGDDDRLPEGYTRSRPTRQEIKDSIKCMLELIYSWEKSPAGQGHRR